MSKGVTITTGEGAYASKVFVNGADEALTAMLIAEKYTTTKNGNLVAPAGLTVGEVGTVVSSFTAALAANKIATQAPASTKTDEFAFEVNVKDGKSYVHGIKEDSKWHKALIAAGATLTKTGDLKIPDGKVAATFLEDALGKEKIEKFGGIKVNDLDDPLNEKEPTLSDYAARADEMAKTPEGAKILTETAADLVAIATRLSKAAQSYSVN